jgi:integrase
MRQKTRVTIYQRVKHGTKWGRKRVAIPPLKKDGTLFLKDDRQGIFQLCWHESRQKQWQNVKGRVSENELPFLTDAITQAEDKSWFLNNRDRRVYDPTRDIVERKKLFVEVPRYIEAKSGCKKTVSAHEHAVREFLEWAKKPKKGRGLVYVDEISKALLRRFFEYLVDGDEDDDGPANHPFTAAFKVMRVNSFVRAALGLEPGKGPVTKKDYKRELKSSRVPEIYTRQDLDALFSVMNEEEHLIFSTLYGAGLRKRELMHLEDSDLISDELVPGCFKTEIRIESKPNWKHQTKTGSDRLVYVPRELMERLLRWKEKARPSKLLFGTSMGKPDHHFWDRLKAIAKRAGLDPTTVWLHKFRATAATYWLRSERLGGNGWDIGYVRQQLGHTDMHSIEHYVAMVRNEEMALLEMAHHQEPLPRKSIAVQGHLQTLKVLQFKRK